MRGNTYQVLFSSVIALAACGGDGGYSSGGDFGATPGGVKDLHFARELVAKGQIPPPAALLVEAMFAEHDLGLSGAPCERTLCVRGAAGFAPELDGTPRGWAQVGLSSTIDPATWQRPSTTFVFTVDVSGSMQWGSESTPAGMARHLLHELADELRPDDRVAIVSYGDVVTTKLSLTAGSETATIRAAIDNLSEEGVTSMEAGMQRAYEIGQAALGTTEQVRIVVFTDTQPNVGASDPKSFNGLVSAAATKGVNTTVMAFGTGVGAEVLRAMAGLRGANAFSMMDHEQVSVLMEDEYPWFTTPVAYGLRVNVANADGWAIDRGLGFPTATDGEPIGLKAETVFLSRRKGALLVALESPDGTPTNLGGTFSLSYYEPDGTQIIDEAQFGYDGSTLADGRWFQQHGVDRTVALAVVTDGMHEAAMLYADDPELAADHMAAAAERFTADAARLGDEDLTTEVDFVNKLNALFIARAPQGTLYGQ
jgi:Ca-activated chloride channel homolog